VKLTAVVALLLFAVSTTSGAPASTRLETTGRATVWAGGGDPGVFQLQTFVAPAHSGWSLRGDVLTSGWRFGGPGGESAVGITLAAPLTHELSVEGLAIERFASYGSGTRPVLGARLIESGSRVRVWAGGVNTTSGPGAPTGGPLLQAGSEVAIGRLLFSGSLARSASTYHVTIPGPTIWAADTIVPLATPAQEVTRRSVGSTLRLGGMWSARRWSIETIGALRWESALPTGSWLRVESAWWLMPTLALRLGLGREAADPSRVGLTPHTSSVALEWTRPHWESGASPAKVPRDVVLRVANVAGDLRRIEITAPGARRVEAVGDFTMWEPVELHRSSGSTFVIELHVAPGVYRVQVRRDGGGWMIPANLPGMNDPDLGEAGSLVIE